MTREGVKTYCVVPIADQVVCCALDGLDGCSCYEADETFNGAVGIGGVFCGIYEHDVKAKVKRYAYHFD